MAIGATHKKMVKKRRERERLWIVGRSRFTEQKSWWRFCVLSMMEHHLKIMRISKIWNVFFCSDFSETKQRVVGSELRICISQFKKPWSEIFKRRAFHFLWRKFKGSQTKINNNKRKSWNFHRRNWLKCAPITGESHGIEHITWKSHRITIWETQFPIPCTKQSTSWKNLCLVTEVQFSNPICQWKPLRNSIPKLNSKTNTWNFSWSSNLETNFSHLYYSDFNKMLTFQGVNLRLPCKNLISPTDNCSRFFFSYDKTKVSDSLKNSSNLSEM